MLDWYKRTALSLEQQWRDSENVDDQLTVDLTEVLDKADTRYNMLGLENKNLTAFIRAYKSAFQRLIDRKFPPTKASKKKKKQKVNKLSANEFNAKMKETFKHDIYFSIETLQIHVTLNPSSSHLGDGYVKGVGKYNERQFIISP